MGKGRTEMIKREHGMRVSTLPIYKVEWHKPGHGVHEETIEARSADTARNKIKRRYGVPKSQQVVTKIIAAGKPLTHGLLYNLS